MFRTIIIALSLIVLATPVVNANTLQSCIDVAADPFDTSSQENIEEDTSENVEDESKITMYCITSQQVMLYVNTTPLYKHVDLHYTYKDNSSLYKPPIRLS